MKIYLDSSALQRPLDSVDQVRVTLEIEALLGILEQIDSGAIGLVASEVLEMELDQLASPMRKGVASNLLAQANEFVMVSEKIEQRVRHFASFSVKPLAALHIACAEASAADYFCTCDERLLRKSRAISDLTVKVVSPLALIEELEL